MSQSVTSRGASIAKQVQAGNGTWAAPPRESDGVPTTCMSPRLLPRRQRFRPNGECPGWLASRVTFSEAQAVLTTVHHPEDGPVDRRLGAYQRLVSGAGRG